MSDTDTYTQARLRLMATRTVDIMSNTYTHEYSPAKPAKTSPRQRYFKHHNRFGAMTVMRFADQEVATVGIRISTCGARAEIDAYMTPEQLRTAASQLLDAAHDIETNPATVAP